ncbi:MAG: DNA-binding transcriptional MerR regulator [Paracrocinitomix sp.]|jgi:DNA-binding transcriptional MerR regulator
MKIGDLANECGIQTQTIRFYERRRLLPPPARAANGYRVYDQHIAERVRFIQRAQTAGLTLAEIGGILDVRANGQPPCTHVSELLNTKLQDIGQRITELTELRSDLVALVKRSHTLNPVDCPPDQICHILSPDR